MVLKSIWFNERFCYAPEVHGTLLKGLPGQGGNSVLALSSRIFKELWRTPQRHQASDLTTQEALNQNLNRKNLISSKSSFKSWKSYFCKGLHCRPKEQ